MKTQNKMFILLLALTVVISACGGGVSTDAMDKPEDVDPADAMMEKPAEETMAEPHATFMPETSDEAMPDDTMMESPAWFGVSLTNVQTGEAFTINEFKGKVVLVETMAIWCSNCKRQQGQVKDLHGLLGERDDFVSLGLDIDSNENADSLKNYINANGFDWYYAVSPEDVSREIASLYGGQFLNPPSTPMLIIDRKGVAHPLPFGIKSAGDLLNALQPFLDEGM
ncbi:MAG TPA: TlpA disulfide reductase family protein [Anaerolineales bacterium]